jgi:hypothetical protein
VYDVTPWFQDDSEFTGRSLGAIALRDLGFVLLVEYPDALANHTLRIAIGNFAAGKTVNSRLNWRYSGPRSLCGIYVCGS